MFIDAQRWCLLSTFKGQLDDLGSLARTVEVLNPFIGVRVSVLARGDLGDDEAILDTINAEYIALAPVKESHLLPGDRDEVPSVGMHVSS